MVPSEVTSALKCYITGTLSRNRYHSVYYFCLGNSRGTTPKDGVVELIPYVNLNYYSNNPACRSDFKIVENIEGDSNVDKYDVVDSVYDSSLDSDLNIYEDIIEEEDT